MDESLQKYLIGMLSIILLSLKDHYTQVWNIFDITMFILAIIPVPIAIMEVSLKHNLIHGYDDIQSHHHLEDIMDDNLPKQSDDEFQKVVTNILRHQSDFYTVGYLGTIESQLFGFIICLVVMKCLYYLQTSSK